MGVLDWLTSSLGSGDMPPGAMAPDDPGSAMRQAMFRPSPSAPSAPPQPTAAMPSPPPAAAPPPIDPSTTDIAAGIPPGMPGPPAAGPRPPLAAGPPPTPPMATPAANVGMVAAPSPTAATLPPPQATNPGDGISIIGRALGLDRNADREMAGHFGSGLTGVAANWNKPGLAAFAGGAGAALQGGSKAQDKIIGEQKDALNSAINAVQVGDKRALMKAQTQKALADALATQQGRGSKDSVVNSEAQLYLRAQGATNQDGQLKVLKSQYDATVKQFGVDGPEAKAAKAAYDAAYKEKFEGHLQSLGIDPKKAAKIGKTPGMSEDNPIAKEKMNSQKAYDDLPPGSYFTNPKDGRILQKPMAPAATSAQGGAPAPPAAGAAPPAAGGAPPPPPTLPPAPPGKPMNAMAQSTDDDEDD